MKPVSQANLSAFLSPFRSSRKSKAWLLHMKWAINGYSRGRSWLPAATDGAAVSQRSEEDKWSRRQIQRAFVSIQMAQTPVVSVASLGDGGTMVSLVSGHQPQVTWETFPVEEEVGGLTQLGQGEVEQSALQGLSSVWAGPWQLCLVVSVPTIQMR